MPRKRTPNLIQTFRDSNRFWRIPESEKEYVFYAEAASDWLYFEPLIKRLISHHGKQVIYLTSDPKDPVLDQPGFESRVSSNSNTAFRALFIGSGILRTLVFQYLHAKVMVMTMPDLESFHIKRSVYPVHYVYLFHSLVSTHMIYREKAFDAFDTIFLAGPHHEKEIRAREKNLKLKPKFLVPFGYARLDQLLAQAHSASTDQKSKTETVVIVAPSWGPTSITSTCLSPLLRNLLDAGIHTVFRPHPMSFRVDNEKMQTAIAEFKNHPLFEFETDLKSMRGILHSDLMISDWSGAAFDYAFAFKKPVVFIDVERKVNNPSYVDLSIEPMEVAARHEVGIVIQPTAIDTVAATIKNLLPEPYQARDKIDTVMQQWVFNAGRSAEVGAEKLIELSQPVKTQPTDQVRSS